MAEPLLEVIDLGRRFGAREVVRQLTFSVQPGEMVALLGPNGAGKTTTLRLLATLLWPTTGHIYLQGLDLVRQPRQARRRLGYLPEHLGVPEGVTAREYLDLHAACHGLSRRRRRPLVEDVLQLCDLRQLGSREVSTLSRGGRQRVLLGRALVHDPGLLLLDEPLSGLDLRARHELLEVLRELARLGKAILLSSHALRELTHLCTHVALLEAGGLRAWGRIEQVARQLSWGGRLQVLVEVEGEPARAREVLERQDRVTAVRQEGELVVVDLDGSREQAGLLAGALAEAGVPILRFQVREPDLEDLFMALTRGEVT